MFIHIRQERAVALEKVTSFSQGPAIVEVDQELGLKFERLLVRREEVRELGIENRQLPCEVILIVI